MQPSPLTKIYPTAEQTLFIRENYNDLNYKNLAEKIGLHPEWTRCYVKKLGLIRTKKIKREKRKQEVQVKFKKNIEKIAEVLEDYRNNFDKPVSFFEKKHHVTNLHYWITNYLLPAPPSDTNVTITLKSKI